VHWEAEPIVKEVDEGDDFARRGPRLLHPSWDMETHCNGGRWDHRLPPACP
jgi:hypothetical protein